MMKKEFIKALLKEAGNYGLNMRGKNAESLYLYYRELFIWNKKINLISRKEENRFIERHIIDSLSILLNLTIEKNDRMLDLGSGNGLPGIPFAIMLQGRIVDLLESNMKKCVFLRHMKSKLGLENTTVYCERFEKIYKRLDKYNYVLVRGKRISEKEKKIIMHCLRKHGSLIIYAGVKANTSVLKLGKKVEYFKGIRGRKIVKINHV